MFNQMYMDYNHSLLKDREFSLKKHKEKLEEISKRSLNMPAISRQKSRPYRSSIRLHEINRENQSLLNKIADISRRSNPTIYPHSIHRPSNARIIRKQEFSRIAKDNELFVKRIVQMEPFLNIRKLEDQFRIHKENVHRISRKKAMHKNHSNEKLPVLRPRKKTASTPENKEP